jgi:hypothetical protein
MSATPERSADTHEVALGGSDLSGAEKLPEIAEPAVRTLRLIRSADGQISVVPDVPHASIRDLSGYETEQKFRRLVDQWRKETEHISSIAKASMHPAYQRIIGMGYTAIPYLLRELQKDPDHWFWALNAITEQDPAQSEETFDGAVRAWLRWGKGNGHL